MNKSNFNLREDEKIIFSLRSIFEKHGYELYKMLKFEEYDLYVQNKEFLVSDNVITFNDTNGKLLALKPDVTLSIIKNTRDCPEGVRKVYYNENVYRVSKSSNTFREIMQVGAECIGDIDGYCLTEMLSVAAQCLRCVSDSCVLCVTDLDVIKYVIEKVTDDVKTASALLKLAGEKNLHGIASLCREEGIDGEKCALFSALVALHGKPGYVLSKLGELIPDCPTLPLLTDTMNALTEYEDIIELDFSYSGDLNYYNGIAFKGYISGIPVSVLTGGQYDRLMKKMGKKSKAIGFAVYLDELEKQFFTVSEYDVDVLLHYGRGADRAALLRKVNEINAQGLSVLALRNIPQKLRYRSLVEFDDGE